MARNLIVFGVALVVGLGLAWLLLGDHGPGGGEAIDRHPDATGAGDERAEGAGGTAKGSAGRDPDLGPVLFGRPRAERTGLGGVAGRVAAAEDDAPIPEADLLLVGVGFGDEEVQVRAVTSTDGTFHLGDVPAGDDYVLRVTAEGKPERTWPGVSVRDGILTKLGTVWLGAQIPFEGRVVDAAGLGIARAEVKVFLGHFSVAEMFGKLQELFADLDRELEPHVKTSTEPNGRFHFATLDPGPVTLAVRAPGFAPGFLPVVVAPTGKTTKPIVVRLSAGTVVAGRVVDPSGRGISGARIAALADQDPVSFWIGRTFVDTLGDGSFRVDTAGTDEVVLLATYPGYPLSMTKAKGGDENVRIVLERGCTLTVRVLDDASSEPVDGAMVMLSTSETGSLTEDGQSLSTGTTDRAGRVTFEVAPGKMQMVMVTHAERPAAMWMGGGMGVMAPGLMKGPEDATIPKGRREVTFRLQATVVVRGRVTDESDSAIVGARVRSFGGFQFNRAVLSDADGRYELSAARGGFGGIVMVQADGYVPATVSLGGGKDAPEVIEKDVTLVRAAVVSGRVLDESGQPIAGAQVQADKGEAGPMMFASGMTDQATGVTGKNGGYVLDGVPPGDEVRILAHRPGYVDRASERFAVTAGGSLTGKDVILIQGATLEVTVEDPTGRRVPGAKVELAYDRDDEVVWDALQALMGGVASRTADRSGSLREENVPPGRVTITASHAEWASAQVVVPVDAGTESPVSATVTLRRPVTIEGQVLDAQGAPLAGASVRTVGSSSAGSWIAGQTDEDGRFRLERVAEGEVTLQVSAMGHQNRTVTLAGPTADLVVRLEAHDLTRSSRRTVVLTRLAELGQQIQSAESDEERQALTKEIQALQEELADVMDDEEPVDPDVAVPVPVEDDR